VGGGPAGCAAAIVLATCGHDVRVVTRPVADERPLPESIPPSTVKLFDLLGVRAAIDRAGFVRSSGNTVWWGSAPARVETFPNAALGWQVTSDRLQPILQQAAVSTGARVVSGRLDVQQASDLGAQITLDCTGRSGVLARARGLRRAATANKTVALVGLWQADEPLTIADPTHTWIESYEAGWAWSVPAIEDRRFVAVMVDPRTSDLVHDQSAKRVYLAELQRTRGFLAGSGYRGRAGHGRDDAGASAALGVRGRPGDQGHGKRE